MFGWLPVLLWILIGGVFFGAVTDFGALYASVKNQGKSMGMLIEKYIGKLGRKLTSALLTLALLVSVLPIGAAPAQAADTAGAFEVTGGTSGTDYSYSNGVLTVNDGASITISMASEATIPTSDRIVVAENATATITLNDVNIKGSANNGTSQAPLICHQMRR